MGEGQTVGQTMRFDAELKERADKVLHGLGISMNGYLNMALVALVQEGAVPFRASWDEEFWGGEGAGAGAGRALGARESAMRAMDDHKGPLVTVRAKDQETWRRMMESGFVGEALALGDEGACISVVLSSMDQVRDLYGDEALERASENVDVRPYLRDRGTEAALFERKLRMTGRSWRQCWENLVTSVMGMGAGEFSDFFDDLVGAAPRTAQALNAERKDQGLPYVALVQAGRAPDAMRDPLFDRAATMGDREFERLCEGMRERAPKLVASLEVERKRAQEKAKGTD